RRHRAMAGQPAGDRVRHHRADGARERGGSRVPARHLRPRPSRRRHRPVGRSAHPVPVYALPAERAAPASRIAVAETVASETISARWSRRVSRMTLLAALAVLAAGAAMAGADPAALGDGHG